MKLKLYCLFIILQITLLCFDTEVFAHDNDIIHPGLARKAINYLYEQKGYQYQEVYDYGFFDVDTDSQCGFIDEGSVKEDFDINSITSWNNSLWGYNACEGTNFSYNLNFASK